MGKQVTQLCVQECADMFFLCARVCVCVCVCVHEPVLLLIKLVSAPAKVSQIFHGEGEEWEISSK